MSAKNYDGPKCPACGIPYALHAGLNGTCAALHNSLAKVRELLAEKPHRPPPQATLPPPGTDNLMRVTLETEFRSVTLAEKVLPDPDRPEANRLADLMYDAVLALSFHPDTADEMFGRGQPRET